ncbi:ionotropic receptor 75a [Anopheles nili]|uniref:ionotropic receptor 75a n=1 Tax=Anopheles nili TaxID=185578 RepID=UPI00237B9C83|nr:ionotropic receptor 75a [Anopheles nili]
MLKVSTHRYLNNTVSWLLVARNASQAAIQSTLWQTRGIQMNTDLLTAVQRPEADEYDLFDVYAKGRHLCKDIYQSWFGSWRQGVGFTLTTNYSAYRTRQNFNFLQLRGVTVIDRENVTSDMVDGLLSEPGLTKGIVAFVKYHYALLVVLRDFHNFTIKYRPTRGWAGRLRSGYRLGLLGVVQRHETDVAATGIIMRLSRQPELDSIHYSWAFETGFIYKITPDIGSKSEGNGFVAPFSTSVWIALLLSVALSVVVLRRLARCSERWAHRNVEPTRAIMAYVLDVVSCVAQQGVPHVSRCVPARIAVMVLLVANLVLYNYYTSTVVSGLLSAKMIGPETIAQVIDSPLKLSLTDTGYHRILLREQTLPYSTRMHDRKAVLERSPDELPLFTDVEHAVPYLRRGGHVLHCELTEVYPTIANQFTANEICELRTVEGLYKYDIRVMAFVLPKHSMYSEMFKITLMRAQETGVVKRIYRIQKIAKPICQGSATVYSVALTEVSLAFIILGAELSGATRDTNYLSPFTNTVWYATALLLLLVLLALQFAGTEQPSFSLDHCLIDMIGLIAQQGTTQTSARFPLRLVLYAVLLMNFLLYNYYAASIVGELLSGTNEGPQTIDQLAKAPLSVVFNDDSYNRALTEDNETLASVRKLNPKQRPVLTRATEVGIIRRLLKTYHHEMPPCQAGPIVHAVVLAGVATPFTILGGGMVSSLVILAAELIVHHVQRKRGLAKQHRA